MISVISRSDCSRARLIYLIKPSAGLQRGGETGQDCKANVTTVYLQKVYIPGRFSLQSAAVMLFKFLFMNDSLEINPWKLQQLTTTQKKLSL